MTKLDPSERPSATEALTRCEEIVSVIPGYVRRQRLREIGKGKIALSLHDVGSLQRVSFLVLHSMLSMCDFLISCCIETVLIRSCSHMVLFGI